MSILPKPTGPIHPKDQSYYIRILAALESCLEDYSQRSARLKATKALIDKALAERPHSDIFHALLARYYAMQFDHEKSIAAVEQAIALNPNRASHYEQKGAQLMWQDRYEAAKAAFEKALELDPDYSRARDGLAYIYEQMGEWEKALEAYHRILETGDFYPENVQRKRGLAFLELERWEEALADLQATLDVENNHRGLLGLGRVHLALGDAQAAIRFIEQALEEKSRFTEAYRWLGKAHFQAENYHSALRAFSTYLEKEPEEAAIYAERAATHLLLEDKAAAMADFDRAVDLGLPEQYLQQNRIYKDLKN